MLSSPLRVFTALEEPKGYRNVCWTSLAKHKHTCSEELCELPLPWMIYANPKHRGPWQTPSPSAAKIRTDRNSGKQWGTSKRTCLLAQTYLAFPPPSTTNPLWENQISSSSCQLITGPLTSTLHQVLDDLILGRSLCRNRGNGDFPVKTFFLLDSQYYSLQCLPV